MATNTTNPAYSALLPDHMRAQFVAVPMNRDAAALRRHPLSAIWGDMAPDAYASFAANFGAKPIPELCDIYLYQDEVLDGWHRNQAAVDTDRASVLRYYAYVGDEPAKLALILNGRRQQLTPKLRAIAAVECLAWQPPGTTPVLGSWSMDDVARSVIVSARHLHRAVLCRDAGLLDLVKRDDVTLEDGEAIAKNPSLLAGLRNGSDSVEDAVGQVRNVRRRKILNRRQQQPSPEAEEYARDLARLEARIDQLVESRNRALSEKDEANERLFVTLAERDALLAALNDPTVVTVLDPSTGQADPSLAAQLLSQPAWTIDDLRAGRFQFGLASPTAPAVTGSTDVPAVDAVEPGIDGELARFNAETVALLGFDPAAYPTVGDIGKDRPDGFPKWSRGEKNRWTRQLNRSLDRAAELRRQARAAVA